jgi:hypothetical protein
MKNTIAILFFFLPFHLFSQDTLSKWSWGATFGLERCGRTLKAEDGSNADLDIWNGLEEKVWRFAGGLRIQRELGSGLSLFSGINYINRGYSIDTIQDAQLNTLDYSFKSIELPLGIAFQPATGRKNSLLLNASINAAFLIDNTLQYSKDGQTARFEMEAVQNAKPIGWNVSAGLGVRRAVTNTANVDLYLGGNQALSPLAEGSLERRLFSLGLYLSITDTF